MAFLYPLFLAGALAIAIPIALHLLRRDVAPDVPFSAVRLLRKTPVEQTRRRRLKDWFLLAARVAALLLLAAAFARPYFTGSDRESRLHIVAIDRSYSMGAPGRFARALELARAAIEEAGSDRVAVLAFDDRAEVLADPGGRTAARAVLDGLEAGFGGTRYAPLVLRALELSDHGPARLVVISDMQRAGWEDEEPVAVPQGFEIDTRDAGTAASNLAITELRRDGRTVSASVLNNGPDTAAGQARASVEGRVIAPVPFSVPPGATVRVDVARNVPERGVLRVEIDDPHGYPADNLRYLRLDADGGRRVLIVNDGGQAGFYVSRALEAADETSRFEVSVRSSRLLGGLADRELAATRAVVLLSTRSLDRRARDMLAGFVRGGGGLLVAATPEVEPGTLASIMQWPDFSAVEHEGQPAVLAATDLRHPIFRPFGALAANLGQVRFTRAWRVRGDGWDVAARFSDGSPALLERREGAGRVVVFPSDLDQRWNDFPLHPAFVPFAVETVRHLAGADLRREYAVADVPPGARPEPGVQTIAADGRQVMVNVDVRESAPATIDADEFKGMLPASTRAQIAPAERRAQQAEARQSLWRWGLLLMLVVLAAESVAGRAR